MPSGLDGHPDPIVTPERDDVLDAIVELVCRHAGPRTLVGIDGRSGAGKSTFADELAARLVARDHAVVRSTTDSFHRPREERLARGPTSGEGYYLDSHQLDAIVAELLVPFATGAGEVRVAAFDEPSDTPVGEVLPVPAAAVLIFDGLFLQRPELSDHWDITVFLDADARQERRWLDFLLGDLPEDEVERAAEVDARLVRARWPRYRDGWRIYVDAVQPASMSTVVVDNNDLRAPVIRQGLDARAVAPTGCAAIPLVANDDAQTGVLDV